jgi:hypothetical protein
MAGSLTLELGNPAANPEALSKSAVLVARTASCHAPEKTVMTATAEGFVDGHRQTIPLKLVRLSKPGTFAITREWPASGTWALKVIARNPEYKDVAAGAVVGMNTDSIEWGSVKHYFHEPSEAEVASMLDQGSQANHAALKE